MLDIVENYHRIQFQEKLMIQTQEKGEEPHFGHDLGSFFLTHFRKSYWEVREKVIQNQQLPTESKSSSRFESEKRTT